MKLTPTQAGFLDHRLSAETVADVIASTYAREAADKVGEYEGEVKDNIWIQFKSGKHRSCDYFEPKKTIVSKSIEDKAGRAFGDYNASTNWRNELELNY